MIKRRGIARRFNRYVEFDSSCCFDVEEAFFTTFSNRCLFSMINGMNCCRANAAQKERKMAGKGDRPDQLC